jgi:hypothetical protein
MDISNKSDSTGQNNNTAAQSTSSFNARNKFKILSLIISIILVFTIIIVSFVALSIRATVGDEADLIFTLIRIVFIIFATPVAVLLFFIGHRLDDAKNKSVTYSYPIWLEIVGVVIGLYLGWLLSTLWVFIITVSQGTLWTNPVLYIPFPIITPLVTYLCFKIAQVIYSLFDKKARRSGFRMSLTAIILVLPILFYSGSTLLQEKQEVTYQNQVTLTNVKGIQEGNKITFTADVYVPQSDEYNIIATVNGSPKPIFAGALRLNGIENIDGLNNFLLNKGTNKMIFYPNSSVCTGNPIVVSFNVRKVLAYRFTTSQAKVITETVSCNK